MTALLVALTCLPAAGATADDAGPSDTFHPPVPLRADGAVIDHGPAHGHAGPAAVDLDADGDLDLVVGDFGGHFHLYRNDGTRTAPSLTAAGMLRAGDEPAMVPIYCCVGSSPQFADLDGDGHLDLLSGSYEPGTVFWFRGVGDGGFENVATSVEELERLSEGKPLGEYDREDWNGRVLADASGAAVTIHPNRTQHVDAFGSFPFPVDWDGDEDFDLLLGTMGGRVMLHRNEGTSAEPSISKTGVPLSAGGEPLSVPGAHAAVVAADWDGDGDLDLLSGSEQGGVYLFRNEIGPGGTDLAVAETLVAPPQHRGEILLASGADLPVGIRTQIAVADWDGDGKLDLLLGDRLLTRNLRNDLSADERAEVAPLVRAHAEAVTAVREAEARFRRERSVFLEQFSIVEPFTEKGAGRVRAWTRSTLAEEWYASAYDRLGVVHGKLRPFLAKSSEDSPQFSNGLQVRGHVWLFRRR